MSVHCHSTVLSSQDAAAGVFRILPRGHFRPSDSSDTRGPWFLSDQRAQEIVQAASDRQADYPIDYEHALIKGGEARAAGWFKRLEARADGIYATDARWTAAAAQMISAKEYRYISPAFLSEGGTGEITKLINVSLTNYPALHTLADLNAACAALAAMTQQPVDGMTAKERVNFVRIFGATPEALRAVEVATSAAHSQRIGEGFAGTGFTENQQEAWMRNFGKTPAELRQLYP